MIDISSCFFFSTFCICGCATPQGIVNKLIYPSNPKGDFRQLCRLLYKRDIKQCLSSCRRWPEGNFAPRRILRTPAAESPAVPKCISSFWGSIPIVQEFIFHFLFRDQLLGSISDGFLSRIGGPWALFWHQSKEEKTRTKPLPKTPFGVPFRNILDPFWIHFT